MHRFMYRCMYVYTYMYVIHVNVCHKDTNTPQLVVSAKGRVCLYLCMYVYINICMCCIYMHQSRHASKTIARCCWLRARKDMYVSIYVRMYIYLLYVCMYVYTYIHIMQLLDVNVKVIACNKDRTCHC